LATLSFHSSGGSCFMVCGIFARSVETVGTRRTRQPFARLLLALVTGVSMPAVAVAQYPNSTPAPEEVRTGFESITEENSERILKTLVGEGFDGRGTGQEGFVRAAH